jgi:guanosine-3',5'-bis(diphosphate) 3'-pyrophosphohydrolase
LLAIATDIRVLLIKLADRLHNMRTLAHTEPDKRERIAQDTLDIYAPLAGRMGMQDIRDELEDIAFKTLQPKGYTMIEERLRALQERSEGLIGQIETELTQRLKAAGLDAIVKSRRKQPYSIWKKMQRQSIAFEQLSDIYGFRIIVPTVEDCYRALGYVHTTWPVVPGRFKDHISTPKANDYRSIHTTIVGPGRQRVELQIRTQEMHEVAEYGIAAHSLYKDDAFVRAEGRMQLNSESHVYQWLRRTVGLLSEGSNPEEFLENTKMELFHDQVFCFTPKGQLIALPRGATPIDFAYAVHTDVGNTCVGVKINGRVAPLSSELVNGDEVEVVTAKGHLPPPAWEGIVATGKARSEIRKATRAASRKQYAGLGKSILKSAFERYGFKLSQSKLEDVLKKLARPSVEEALAAVGRDELAPEDIVKALHPDWPDPRSKRKSEGAHEQEGWVEVKAGKGVTFKVPSKDAPKRKALLDGFIPIRGSVDDMPIRFAPEGGAVPGDKIVGIITPGEGITVYPIHSPALAAFENQPDRWYDVRWDIDEADKRRFPARVQIHSLNEPGSLAQIAGVIAENDGNIDNIRMTRRSPDFTEMLIDLEVWNLRHLNDIMAQLRLRPNVSQVVRVNG